MSDKNKNKKIKKLKERTDDIKSDVLEETDVNDNTSTFETSIEDAKQLIDESLAKGNIPSPTMIYEVIHLSTRIKESELSEENYQIQWGTLSRKIMTSINNVLGGEIANKELLTGFKRYFLDKDAVADHHLWAFFFPLTNEMSSDFFITVLKSQEIVKYLLETFNDYLLEILSIEKFGDENLPEFLKRITKDFFDSNENMKYIISWGKAISVENDERIPLKTAAPAVNLLAQLPVTSMSLDNRSSTSSVMLTTETLRLDDFEETTVLRFFPSRKKQYGQGSSS